MADPISSLAAGGISGIADAFKTIWSTFKLTPEQKVAADAALEANRDHLADLDTQYKIKVLDAEAAENETAGKNIRADAESGDPVVRRARPMIIWVGLFIMMWNYCVFPMWPGKAPVNFPDMFWYAWMTVATGYVIARTGDKALGGLGGTLSLPGIKLDSKGDK